MSQHPEPGLLSRFETLEGEARAELLDHVGGCAECRARLAEGDPTRLFALLALQPLPRPALDRLSARVDAELDRDARRRPSWPRFGAVASLAASLVLAGLFGIYLTGRSTPEPAPVLPLEGPGPARAEVLSEPWPATDGLELISSPGEAQVMELTVGETQFVMIFDEAMDI